MSASGRLPSLCWTWPPSQCGTPLACLQTAALGSLCGRLTVSPICLVVSVIGLPIAGLIMCAVRSGHADRLLENHRHEQQRSSATDHDI